MINKNNIIHQSVDGRQTMQCAGAGGEVSPGGDAGAVQCVGDEWLVQLAVPQLQQARGGVRVCGDTTYSKHVLCLF